MHLNADQFAGRATVVARCENAADVVGAEVAPLVRHRLKAKGRACGLVGVLPVDEDRDSGHV